MGRCLVNRPERGPDRGRDDRRDGRSARRLREPDRRHGRRNRPDRQHLARGANITDRFAFTHTDDTTITLGYSTALGGNYTQSSSITLSDSISATGGHTFPNATHSYVSADFYWQRYADNDAPGCDPNKKFKEQADHWAGTVYPSTKGDPGYDPFGGCLNDNTWGHTTLAPSSDFSTDRATSQTEDIGTVAYGMSIAGNAGFTNDIFQGYTSQANSPTTYLCGNYYMPNVPVIYNADHQASMISQRYGWS